MPHIDKISLDLADKYDTYLCGIMIFLNFEYMYSYATY